jgi:cell division septal protein FtsQ
VTDLHSRWAETTWEQLVQRRGRRNRKRGAALFILAACLGGLVILGVTWRDKVAKLPLLTIHEIDVSGNRTIPSSEILDLLDLHAQEPWWNYRPDEIRARAAKHPRVQSLALRYGWFHRLRVEVVEREPSLTVLGGPEGEITADGWFLPAEAAGEESDLPILRPSPGTLSSIGAPVDRRTAKLARLIADLRSQKPAIWRDLSEIDLDGSEARAYLRSRRCVILFTPGLHDELWSQLPTVLEDLEHNHRNDVVLDLRFPGRIVVHLPEAIPADSSVAGKDRNRI